MSWIHHNHNHIKMALNYEWIGYFMPIFSFLFVFVVVYAILVKSKILGESAFINSFVSFIFAIIFVSFSPSISIDYVQTIIPWVAILIICLFFVLVMVGFSQKDMDGFMKPGLAWVFIILLAIVFLVSAIVVFNPVLRPYLPGQPDTGGESFLLSVKYFIYSEKILGALLLVIVAAVTSWILTKK